MCELSKSEFREDEKADGACFTDIYKVTEMVGMKMCDLHQWLILVLVM